MKNIKVLDKKKSSYTKLVEMRKVLREVKSPVTIIETSKKYHDEIDYKKIADDNIEVEKIINEDNNMKNQKIIMEQEVHKEVQRLHGKVKDAKPLMVKPTPVRPTPIKPVPVKPTKPLPVKPKKVDKENPTHYRLVLQRTTGVMSHIKQWKFQGNDADLIHELRKIKMLTESVPKKCKY